MFRLVRRGGSSDVMLSSEMLWLFLNCVVGGSFRDVLAHLVVLLTRALAISEMLWFVRDMVVR